MVKHSGIPARLLGRRRKTGPACTPRPDGAVVHRTRMLHDHAGNLAGRSCGCGEILTASGRPSRLGPAGHVSLAHTVRTLAHLASA